MPQGESPDTEKGQPGVTQAALFGLCPRCQARTLFDAPASLALKCRACGLNFAELERGSRAGALVTFAVAAVLITLALLADEWLRPPLWLMGLIAVPVTIAITLGVLRFFKTTMLMARYERSLETKDQNL